MCESALWGVLPCTLPAGHQGNHSALERSRFRCEWSTAYAEANPRHHRG